MRPLYSPLRYPGGKAKVLNFIKELIAQNDFVPKPIYVEPYAGGAAVAIGLLIQNQVSDVYINDYDPAIYWFWNNIIKNHEQFIEKIYETSVNIHEWHKQVEIYLNSEPGFELGFAAFFLNRCNHSGILKGGVIGGLKQNGKYKLDCRFKKENLVQRIKAIAALKDKIHIYQEDTLVFLQKSEIQKILNRCLLYLDPPYYVKGHQLYKNSYTPEDHKKIADYIRNLHTKWIVSYDNVPEIQALYSDFAQREFNMIYHAGRTIKQGAEIMFFSKSLKKIPELSFIAK